MIGKEILHYKIKKELGRGGLVRRSHFKLGVNL